MENKYILTNSAHAIPSGIEKLVIAIDLRNANIRQLNKILLNTKDLRTIELDPSISHTENLDFIINLVWIEEFISIDTAWLNNIDGLTSCVNLRKLILGSGWKYSLEPLSVLTNLEELSIGGPLKGLKAIKNLKNIRKLTLSGFRIKNLSYLKKMSELNWLMILGGALSDLSDITYLKNLEELRLHRIFSLTNLDPIQSAKSLKVLELSECKNIHSLAALSSLTSLLSLKIDDLEFVSTLSPLAKLSQLENLYFLGTTIEDGDLSPLYNLHNLKRCIFLNTYGASALSELKEHLPECLVDAGPVPR